MKLKDTLTEEEIQTGLKYIIKDGIVPQSMGILTGGAFLIAFAVKLGASNVVIGLLAAIGLLAQLLQLPSILLVEKILNRRAIVVVKAALSQLCWLFITLSPLLFGAKIGLAVLLVLMIAASTLEGKVVFAEVRSQVRTLSSVEGLRQMVSFPFTIVITLRGNKNGN